jgi:hypothetical protein
MLHGEAFHSHFMCSEGQEKYVRELSVTPVELNHSLGLTILHGENEVFQSNRNDFLEGIWGHYFPIGNE